MSQAGNRSQTKSFLIEVLAGPHQGESFSLNKSPVTIGRGSENTICLEKDPRISRQHIKIVIGENEASIINLSVKNLMLVEESPAQEKRVTSDSKIRIGDSLLLFKGNFKSIVVSEPAKDVKPNFPLPPQMPESLVPAVAPTTFPSIVNPPTGAQMSAPVQPTSNSLSQFVSQNLQVKPMEKPSARMPANHHQPQYGIGPSGGAKPPFANSGISAQASSANNKRLYAVVAIIFVAGFFFFKPKSNPLETVAKEPVVRNPAFIESDQKQLTQKINSLKKSDDDMSLDRKRRIDENMVRGLRDMQQGNYQRALESFLVVVSVDPDNVLARRNYHNAKIKLDEQIKYLLLQAKKYREKRNYRLCVSSYQSAESLLLFARDAVTYKQAQQGREFCDLCLQKGAQACQDLK